MKAKKNWDMMTYEETNVSGAGRPAGTVQSKNEYN
jgi:hypothetical protein